jgi:1,4-dihydroxy-2-naphthoate octaprenyltransferase
MIKALRPWSFTTSLLPILIISAVVHDGTTSLVKTNMVAFSILCVHCGSNLANTYYDYVNEIDTRALIEERIYVDHSQTFDNHPDPTLIAKFLSLKQVKAMAIAAYAIGASVTIAMLLLETNFNLTTPIHSAIPTALFIYTVGCLLGYYYTANPFSFKYQGLGEIVVFLCFGPFLTQYVSLMLIQRVPQVLYFYTLPSTLITIALLHANNARDIRTDREAGILTIAGGLGQQRAFQLYQTLLIFAFLSYFYVATIFQHFPCYIVLLMLPYAWKLIKAFRSERFSIVVPGTAKLHLMTGLLFYIGLSLSK